MMKFSKISKRVAACTLAGAMMVSMLGMTVFAEEETKPELYPVKIEKVITTDGNTYAPNTKFIFNAAKAGAGTWKDADVKAGVDDGLIGTTIGSTPGSSTSDEYRIQGNLGVDITKFTSPGIYHYTVTEQEGDENHNKYEGITYSAESYDVYVYINSRLDDAGSPTGELYVSGVTSVKGTTKADLVFTNDYGKTNDTTHDVTITKKVKGEFANFSDTFSFKISVTGVTGEKYKIVYSKTGAAADATEISVVSGGDTTIAGIGNKGYVRIYGLTNNDQYTVEELEANTNGYVTTTSETGSVQTGKIENKKVTADGTQATIFNTQNAVSPTGVAMTVAPYILMVAVAGIFAILFFRRRHEEA